MLRSKSQFYSHSSTIVFGLRLKLFYILKSINYHSKPLTLIGDNFSCKSCKPTKEVSRSTSTETTATKLKCMPCSTLFTNKYNLKRHMVRKHKNDFDESETNVGKKDEKVEEQSDNTEKEDTNNGRNVSILSLLKKIDLEHLNNLFVEAKIYLETLKVMSAFELGKFGVKFGPAKKLLNEIENYKNKKRDTEHLLFEDKEDSTKEDEVQDLQEDQDLGSLSILSDLSRVVSNNEESEEAQTEDIDMGSLTILSDLSVVVSINEESEEAQTKVACMQVCKDAKDLEKPQHRCRFCKSPVSQICPCNIEDPQSDNPQHRVHKTKDLCNSQQIFKCKDCQKIAKNEEALKSHMYAVHQQFNCDYCNSKFNDKLVLEQHKVIH